ncbi:MAG: hypothetical protein WA874_07975 [Chryseosolibacter sp.]
MKTNGVFNKLWWFVVVVVVLTTAHHFILRPWFLDWGAPQHIRSLSLPGDRFTTDKGHTRAVLIQASPGEIWPWIVQLGQDRGGMYSYAWLENLVRADIHNVYQLQEALQQPRMQGDTVWLANPEHYGGQGYQVLAMVIPSKAFVMVGGNDYRRILDGDKALGSWAIYLYPENEHFTWLIARSAGGDFPAGNRILRYFTYEVPHFIMEKKMLKTMKRLAEQ